MADEGAKLPDHKSIDYQISLFKVIYTMLEGASGVVHIFSSTGHGRYLEALDHARTAIKNLIDAAEHEKRHPS